MRGKLKHLGDLIDHRWIIPAHAGQTYRYGCGRHRQPDHPRACGANPVRTVPSLWASGSSPRMRGKHLDRGQRRQHVRIIPAHAGQTTRVYRKHVETADHPRACGANRRCAMVRQLAYGSSPRMRGKLSPTTSRYNFPRIIPAHAGQTAPYVHRTFCRADHPRACGANHDCVRPLFRPFGSSPRMRGKHAVAGAARRVVRIIPAHAGQTCGGRRGPACSADHPRACGANIGVDVSDAFGCGSSPRMRGKLPCARSGRRLRRIIPAHAGQTTS